DGGLYTFNNLLFLSDPVETWTGAQPFDTLLEKWGATVVNHNIGLPDPTPIVRLICLAPDASKAAAIVTTLASSKTYADGSLNPLIALPDAPPYNGKISHADARITCDDLAMWSISGGTRHLAKFLPDLRAYLESQGCTDFALTVSGKPAEAIEDF